MIIPAAASSKSRKTAMARSSPGVRRVAAILNFIAEHPGQGFTLTDLVKALKLSRATCHALLAGLVEVGYLYRASDKQYVLGPALVALARSAAEHASPLKIAQSEMRALADEFDAICSAYFREGDEIVVGGRATSVSNLGWSLKPGTRLKLRAPFGGIYYAWSPRAEAEAWLDTCIPTPTPEQKSAALESMAFTREHGFAFCVRNPHVLERQEPPEQMFGGLQTEFPVYVAAELDPDQEYQLASVTAPVFDSSGHVAFVLGLTAGFTRITRGVEVDRIGRCLREACDRITGFIAGRQSQYGRSFLRAATAAELSAPM
jgi:DNA-binding IclR family transcriptional regulator